MDESKDFIKKYEGLNFSNDKRKSMKQFKNIEEEKFPFKIKNNQPKSYSPEREELKVNENNVKITTYNSAVRS